VAIFIGGTNHGRTDGGIPDPGAKYYRVPMFNLAGVRRFEREGYYRHGGYWIHESLDTPEQVAEAVTQYEARGGNT
jgi:hypothetical protein